MTSAAKSSRSSSSSDVSGELALAALEVVFGWAAAASSGAHALEGWEPVVGAVDASIIQELESGAVRDAITGSLASQSQPPARWLAAVWRLGNRELEVQLTPLVAAAGRVQTLKVKLPPHEYLSKVAEGCTACIPLAIRSPVRYSNLYLGFEGPNTCDAFLDSLLPEPGGDDASQDGARASPMDVA